MTASPRVYFPNLNAVRFVAAVLVILHHIEQLKSILGLGNHWNSPVVMIVGHLAVILFFVLSGFLITYLLLAELRVTGTVEVGSFYVRRILRIWPLYFAIVGLGLFVFPFVPGLALPGMGRTVVWDHLATKVVLFALLLPNVVMNEFGGLPYLGQTWSIGAEEQFYLLWPVLMKHVRSKVFLLWTVIAGYLLVKLVASFLPAHAATTRFVAFWESAPIDCMAIGGLYAYMISSSGRIARRMRAVAFHRGLQWLVLMATIVLMVEAVRWPAVHNEVYAALFGLLVCNLAANERRILNLENGLSAYLGKISYGLYMYHPVAIVLTVRLCLAIGHTEAALLYPLCLTITVLTAAVSYRYFERPFIDVKTRFSAVISGDNASGGARSAGPARDGDALARALTAPEARGQDRPAHGQGAAGGE